MRPATVEGEGAGRIGVSVAGRNGGDDRAERIDRTFLFPDTKGTI
ncbi:MAG: hypothetical protein ACQET5_03570 [Halobacteriota archaeon]